MKKYGDHHFLEDDDGYVHVYTDGSCENNGKPQAIAGFGVYFGEGHALYVSFFFSFFTKTNWNGKNWIHFWNVQVASLPVSINFDAAQKYDAVTQIVVKYISKYIIVFYELQNDFLAAIVVFLIFLTKQECSRTSNRSGNK